MTLDIYILLESVSLDINLEVYKTQFDKNVTMNFDSPFKAKHKPPDSSDLNFTLDEISACLTGVGWILKYEVVPQKDPLNK